MKIPILLRPVSTAVFILIMPSLTLALGGSDADTLKNADVVRMIEANLGEPLIISKINAAQTADFELAIDNLIELKEAGVGEAVIQAMLEHGNRTVFDSGDDLRHGSGVVGMMPTHPVASIHDALGIETIRVALETEEGEQLLRAQRGEFSTVAMGMVTFIDFPGLKARIRTNVRTPTLMVKSKSPLTGGRYFFARLDSDTDDGVRSLKISSVKKRLKSMFGNSRTFMEPDHDWVVDYDVEDLGDDLWRVKPKETLTPGEYGWYVDLGSGAQASTIFDFGID